MLEQHPALHYLFVWLSYNLGQLVVVTVTAYIASKSTLNNVKSIRQYLVLRWVPLGARWILCNFMFFVLWENSGVIDLERFMPNLMAHVGVAGMLGFLSDQIWDKVLAVVLPGINKELPAVPPPEVKNDPTPNP